MTIPCTVSRKRSLRSVAFMASLVLILIGACASAFSMLMWDPAVDPPATAASTAFRDRFERVHPGRFRRVERFGGSRDREILCSLNRAATSHGHHLREATYKSRLHPAVIYLRLLGDKGTDKIG